MIGLEELRGALDGNADHFDAALFEVKPHAGQKQVAAWLRQDLQSRQPAPDGKRLQDRYSIRCAPHVIGVLAERIVPAHRRNLPKE
jgi:histidine ammonia-lyase